MLLSIGSCMAIFCLALACYIVILVKNDKLQLRYSLVWLAMACIVLLCAIFPQPLFDLAHMFGFQVGSNFLFFIGLFFLLCICLSLTSIVSKQQSAIKNLSQRIAILENEFLNKGVRVDNPDK